MTANLRLTLILCVLLTASSLQAQTWQWMRTGVTGGNSYASYPVYNILDDRGNTFCVSFSDKVLVTKYDPYGNVLWTRNIVSPAPDGASGNSASITTAVSAVCTDANGNLYMIARPLTSIDGRPINTPGPYGLLKFDPNGHYLWGRALTNNPAIIVQNFVSTADRIFFTMPFDAFTTFSYDGHSYSALGSNTVNCFVGAIDTADGRLQWGHQFYSPIVIPQCTYGMGYPNISVNSNMDLLVTSTATTRLNMDNTVLLDSSGCVVYSFGLMLDGHTGNLKWAKKLYLDTLPARAGPGIVTLPKAYLSCILSSGYSVVYNCIRQDTSWSVGTIAVNNYSYPVAILDEMYLYDPAGNLIKKAAAGDLRNGWPQLVWLKAGESNTMYSGSTYFGYTPGRIASTELPEIEKWDTTLTSRWRKGLDYAGYFPAMDVNNVDYRKNAISAIIGIAYSADYSGWAYFGNDSLVPSSQTILARMVDSANMISGSVFLDLNKNGIWDANEPPAAGVVIGSLKGDTAYCVSHRDGRFQFVTGPGNYAFQPLNLPAAYHNYSVASPASQAVSLSGYGNFSRGKNFALEPAETITDGSVAVTPYDLAVPGRTLPVRLTVTNTGTTIFSGSCQFSYDSSHAGFNRTNATPTGRTDSSVSFNVPSLNPFESWSSDVFLTVRTTAPAGDTFRIAANLTTTPADMLPSNNRDSVGVIVRASYDPNNKAVYPFNDVNYDSVTAQHQELDYHILFQNTGTDTAYAVLVSDSLDADLDLTTFRLVASSQPVDINWSGARTVQFYFKNILLPDSAENGPASHGFIRFRIKPYPTVKLSDQIRNTAQIYFDYNSPVATDQVVSTFARTRPGSPADSSRNGGGTTADSSSSDLRLYPNPGHDHLYFLLAKNDPGGAISLSVYDASGKAVITGSMVQAPQTPGLIDISDLPQGLYYIRIKTTKNDYTKTFMKW